MTKLLALLLSAVCSAVAAQTPTANLMPDGSRDMFIGVGASSAPCYPGARGYQGVLLPVVQIEWSNGVFVSGPSLGMQLAGSPGLEFGPLLTLMAGRTASGQSPLLGGIVGEGNSGVQAGGGNITVADPGQSGGSVATPRSGNRLWGMDEIGVRAQLGGFFNYYLAPDVRLTNTVLYGSAQRHNGLLWTLDLQRVAAQITTHHSVSLSAGLTVANQSYGASYFGVSAAEAVRSGNRAYAPAAGVRDVHAGLRWNWALGPAWLLTSSMQFMHLTGSVNDSPLVERSNSLTVSSALAYRF